MIYVGDVHRSFDTLMDNLNNIENENVIQVGDFGLGFKEYEEDLKFLETLNEKLKSQNNQMYVIRGNHDNPNFWKMNIESLTNIKLVSDFTYLEIEGLRVLFVGGGLSIDRIKRVVNKSYWVDETICTKFPKVDNPKCDILITHVPLISLFPNLQFNNDIIEYYAINDTKLLEDLKREQDTLKRLLKYCNCDVWVSGHMHQHAYFVDSKRRKYLTLDILEMNKINNIEYKK